MSMAKYLIQASYTAEGARGLLKDGGSKRRTAIRALAESVGGKLESVYYAFGATDVFVVIDAPDNASAAAASLVVGASGAAATTTTVLLTPEEIDQAVKKTVTYMPPGGRRK
jgi:uncharacterized protein with GYD domain